VIFVHHNNRALKNQYQPSLVSRPWQFKPYIYRVLKEAAFQLSNPLSLIFTKSLDEGRIPPERKVATVVPIFKREANHLHQIIIQSVYTTVFESIVCEPTIRHLCSNNLFITSHQHGFLPHKSCVTQLLKAVEKWSESWDNENSVDVLYLDFKKTFDSVPHTRLLKKLNAYGFRGKLLEVIFNRPETASPFIFRMECCT